MKIRLLFLFPLCFLSFGLCQVYAQEMSAVDAAVTETEAEERSEDGEKNDNFFKRAYHFFSNLPFGYDFGCEPTLHGSLTYFNLKYRWSDENQTFARFLFNYGSILRLEPVEKIKLPGSELKKYEDEEKAFDFKLIPWGKQFNSKKAEKRFFTIEPGFNFRIEPEKIDCTFTSFQKTADDEAFFNLYMNQENKRLVVRPFFSTNFSMPLGKAFSVTLDLLYAPVYFYWGSNKMEFSVAGYSKKEGFLQESAPTLDMKYSGSAENYIDADLVLGFFNFVAASCRLIYEKRRKSDFSLTQDLTTVKTENTYERFSLKVGASLINIGKAGMRLKTGVFYQWDWEYNHNADEWFKAGKWIFGVGMRNLY